MCAWDGTGRRRDKEQKSSLLYADVKRRNRESQSIPHEKQGIKLAPHDEGMIRHSIKKIRKIPWNCIWGHESLTPIIKKPKPSIWLTLSIRKTLGGVARSWLQDRQIWLTALFWITVPLPFLFSDSADRAAERGKGTFCLQILFYNPWKSIHLTPSF